MGFSFMLNYKGREKHQTYLGAFFSIIIKIIVLIVTVNKAIDLVNMNDPTITSLERPMLRNEIDEYGAINLQESLFTIGITVLNDDGSYIVPSGIGRFILLTSDVGSDEDDIVTDLVPCGDTFGQLTEAIKEDDLPEIEGALCADP